MFNFIKMPGSFRVALIRSVRVKGSARVTPIKPPRSLNIPFCTLLGAPLRTRARTGTFINVLENFSSFSSFRDS